MHPSIFERASVSVRFGTVFPFNRKRTLPLSPARCRTPSLRGVDGVVWWSGSRSATANNHPRPNPNRWRRRRRPQRRHAIVAVFAQCTRAVHALAFASAASAELRASVDDWRREREHCPKTIQTPRNGTWRVALEISSAGINVLFVALVEVFVVCDNLSGRECDFRLVYIKMQPKMVENNNNINRVQGTRQPLAVAHAYRFCVRLHLKSVCVCVWCV